MMMTHWFKCNDLLLINLFCYCCGSADFGATASVMLVRSCVCSIVVLVAALFKVLELEESCVKEMCTGSFGWIFLYPNWIWASKRMGMTLALHLPSEINRTCRDL